MGRKRKNPMKIGRGEYRYYPEEIELMGKIPDYMIAKIFETSTPLITKERKARGISSKGSVISSEKVKAVLDSIDAPRAYYNALGLGELFAIEKERKKKLKRQEQRKRRMEKYRQQSKRRQQEKEVRKLERKRRAELGAQRGIFAKRGPEIPLAEKYEGAWKRFPAPPPINIDDFFEPESDFDRRRRLAIEQDTSNMNQFSRIVHDKPQKNPSLILGKLDQVIEDQVDQFQDDLLHNPLTAYFKLLGFMVGATAFSLVTVAAIKNLSEKLRK